MNYLLFLNYILKGGSSLVISKAFMSINPTAFCKFPENGILVILRQSVNIYCISIKICCNTILSGVLYPQPYKGLKKEIIDNEENENGSSFIMWSDPLIRLRQ